MLTLLAALAVSATTQVAAQEAARVVVTVDSATQFPSVRVLGLLNESRWQEALSDAFSIRLSWRVELWRDRAIFDQNVRELAFDIVIRRDPLLGQYRYTVFQANEPPRDGVPFTELDRFASQVETPILLRNFGPPSPGSYYYAIELRVSALDDDELNEMRRFMGSGDGGSILDAIRGGILKLVSIPAQTMSTRSPRFSRP